MADVLGDDGTFPAEQRHLAEGDARQRGLRCMPSLLAVAGLLGFFFVEMLLPY